ncbi:MAG: hypothetical protein ACRDZ8_05100 [Acidimicrobiales bacterium]
MPSPPASPRGAARDRAPPHRAWRPHRSHRCHPKAGPIPRTNLLERRQRTSQPAGLWAKGWAAFAVLPHGADQAAIADLPQRAVQAAIAVLRQQAAFGILLQQAEQVPFAALRQQAEQAAFGGLPQRGRAR